MFGTVVTRCCCCLHLVTFFYECEGLAARDRTAPWNTTNGIPSELQFWGLMQQSSPVVPPFFAPDQSCTAASPLLGSQFIPDQSCTQTSPEPKDDLHWKGGLKDTQLDLTEAGSIRLGCSWSFLAEFNVCKDSSSTFLDTQLRFINTIMVKKVQKTTPISNRTSPCSSIYCLLCYHCAPSERSWLHLPYILPCGSSRQWQYPSQVFSS